MKLPSRLGLVCSLCAFNELASALRVAFEGRASSAPRSPSVLGPRSSMLGNSDLANSGNILYFTNITLNGTNYEVQIDTGSADLWVNETVPGAHDTGKIGSLKYAVGAATGPIKTATLELAGISVTDQAFIQVNSSVDLGVTGIIGLGPSSNSALRRNYTGKAGDPPLDRIFAQNHSTPNYITFNLGRADSPSDPSPGDLTVGEIIPGYEAISNETKLGVTDLPMSQEGSQHWQMYLDEDGFVGPDGNVKKFNSVVSKTDSPKQLRVVVDTGFTYPQVPADMAKAIYSQVPNAKLVDQTEAGGAAWIIPCDQEVNITFRFAGKSYPIHPLDMTYTSSTGECIGSFQPLSFAQGSKPTYDVIFGMAFLRNVYALINFGDFVDGGASKFNPYIQFLSTTNDTAKAHQDFVQVRLNGTDTTTERNLLGHSNTPSGPSKTNKKKSILRTVIIAVVVGVIGLILLVGVCCFCGAKLLRGRRAKNNTAYAPLSAPAPAPAVDMQQAPASYQAPYNQAPYNPYQASAPAYNAQQHYTTPYDQPHY